MNLSATSSKTSPARALYVRQCRHLRAQPSSSHELAPDIALHNDTSLERCFPSCLRDFYNNSSSISYFLALLYLLSTSKFFVVFSSLLFLLLSTTITGHFNLRCEFLSTDDVVVHRRPCPSPCLRPNRRAESDEHFEVCQRFMTLMR